MGQWVLTHCQPYASPQLISKGPCSWPGLLLLHHPATRPRTAAAGSAGFSAVTTVTWQWIEKGHIVPKSNANNFGVCVSFQNWVEASQCLNVPHPHTSYCSWRLCQPLYEFKDNLTFLRTSSKYKCSWYPLLITFQGMWWINYHFLFPCMENSPYL